MSCFLSLNIHTQPDAPVERWITLSPVTRNGRHKKCRKRRQKKRREVMMWWCCVVLVQDAPICRRKKRSSLLKLDLFSLASNIVCACVHIKKREKERINSLPSSRRTSPPPTPYADYGVSCHFISFKRFGSCRSFFFFSTTPSPIWL